MEYGLFTSRPQHNHPLQENVHSENPGTPYNYQRQSRIVTHSDKSKTNGLFIRKMGKTNALLYNTDSHISPLPFVCDIVECTLRHPSSKFASFFLGNVLHIYIHFAPLLLANLRESTPKYERDRSVLLYGIAGRGLITEQGFLHTPNLISTGMNFLSGKAVNTRR